MRLRYVSLAALCALLLAPAATAQQFVNWSPIPGNPSIHDLDYRDGHVWAMVRTSTNQRILKLDPADATIVETVPLTVTFTPLGLAWDGEAFWVSRSFTSNARLYRIGTDGQIIRDIPAPSPLSNGLTWLDGELWVSRANPNPDAALVRVDPATGAELSAIPAPQTQPGGIAHLPDGTTWVSNVGDDGTNIEQLYRLDRATGEVLQTVDLPEGGRRPKGLAWDGGQYLYLAAVVNNQHGIYTIDLGAAGNPQLVLSAPSLDFGLTVVGTPEAQSLTLTNAGNAPLAVSDVALAGHEAFSTTFAGATVDPGESVPVFITFSPQSYGPHAATLTFATNDVAQPTVSVPLAGHGLFPDRTALASAPAHNFGAVRIEDPYGDRAVRTWALGVINAGAEPLTVTGLTVPEPFEVDHAPDFPSVVAPADTLWMRIGFRPVETGTVEAEALIATDDPAAPALAVTLTGTGVNPELTGGDPLWTLTVPDHPGSSFQDRKVHSIRSLGDVTGDGTADLVVATRNYLVFAVRGNSWETGEILWTFDSCKDNFNCGSVSGVDGLFNTGLAAGEDLDGDGYPDVIFGTGGGNDHVYALSGRTGQVIWSAGDVNDPYLATYYAVSFVPDVTGDGIPEVAAVTGTASSNSPNPYNQRRVYLFNGATGEVLWQRHTPSYPNFAVSAFTSASGEVRVAAGGSDPGVAAVVAYDGATGTPVWTHTATATPFLIVPYPRDGGGYDVLYTGGSNVNQLVRLDGETGEVVWQATGLPIAWSLEVTRDLNGNGAPDLLMGLSNGAAYAVSGTDGAGIWSDWDNVQVFGVAGLRDIDGDGVPEVAIATADGRVRLLSGATGEGIWAYSMGSGAISQAVETVTILPDIDGNNAPQIVAGTRHGRIAMLAATGEVLPTSTPVDGAPAPFALAAPYPNPARGETTLSFSLPTSAPVRVAVYDLLGRRVALLHDEPTEAGTHALRWSGRDGAGAPLSAGVYVVRLEADGRTAAQRVSIVR